MARGARGIINPWGLRRGRPHQRNRRGNRHAEASRHRPCRHHAARCAELRRRDAVFGRAKASIISPADGATVSNPLTVAFGLKGMGVAPAGTEKAKTGHHHLLLDVDSVSMDGSLPSDEQHRHFGGGQTGVTLELPAGQAKRPNCNAVPQVGPRLSLGIVWCGFRGYSASVNQALSVRASAVLFAMEEVE